MVWEASAFLGAARTAVDLLVYIAARRAGKAESTADRWEASEAISPKVKSAGPVPTRYDVPEVLALRARLRWFERLNRYRNVVYHRGLGSKHYGYCAASDTADQASDPEFNAMLLPDESSLRNRKRPHDWTYNDGSRLDTLIDELDEGLTDLLEEVLTRIWNCEVPKEGEIPRSEQPDTMLFLATPVFLEGQHLNIVPVFDSKFAARAFEDIPPGHKDSLTLRAIRPTTTGTDAPHFLLSVLVDHNANPWEVRVYTMAEGKLALAQCLVVEPQEAPIRGLTRLRALSGGANTLYVWQPTDR